LANRKEYELLFKLQGALGGNFKSTFKTAMSTTKKLQGTITKINSLSGKIDGYQKQSNAVEKNRTKLTALKEEHEKLQSEMKQTETPSDELRRKFEKTERQIDSTTKKIQGQETRLKSLGQELKDAGINTNNLEASNMKLSKSYEAIKRSQETIAKVSEAQQKNAAAIANTKSQLIGTTGTVAALAAAFYAGPIKSAKEFESAMADVAKVVDGLKDGTTGELTAEYRKMKNEILDLSTKIPVTTKGLTEIAAAAGQAGIARREIIPFTSDAAKMGIAFDSTADQAGEWLAKWRTSFGLSQDQVVELADKINYLSNTSAANAEQISTIVTKVGPLGEVAGFANGEIAALGATLVAVGVKEDVAATGIKKVMTTMTAGTAATKRQKEVLDSLGMSAGDLAVRMQKDAKGALLDFMKAVNKLPEAEKAATLKNYFGEEAVASIAPMLTKLDMLEEQFIKVGDATKYAGSMESEYATRAATTDNKTQLMVSSITKAAVVLGDVFLPEVAEVAVKITELTNRFSNFAQANPELIKQIGKIALGLAGFKIASLTAKLGFLELQGGVLAVQKVFALFRGKTALASVEAIGFSKKLTQSGAGMKNYFGGIRKSLGGIGKVLGSSFKGGRIVSMFSGVGKIFGGIGPTLIGSLSSVSGKVVSLFGGVGSRIIAGPLGRIGMFVLKPFMMIGRFLGPLVNLAGAVLGPFAGIMGSIMPVVGVVMLVITAVQLLRDNLDGVRSVVQNVFGDAGLKVFDNIIEVIDTVIESVQYLFSDKGVASVKKVIDKTFGKNKKLAEFLKAVVDVVATVGNILGEFIAFVDQHVKPIISDAFMFIVNTVLPLMIQKFTEWAPTIVSILTGVWTIIKTVGTQVMKTIKFIMPIIKSVVKGGIESIVEIIDGVLKVIRGITEFLAGAFTGDWKRAWQGIRDIFAGIFESLTGIAKAPINAVISMINGMVDAINSAELKIPDWVPGVGGETLSAGVGKIPMFAKGTNQTPDTFIAGEKGAELVTGAKNRKVFTALQTTRIFENMRAVKEKSGFESTQKVVMIAPALQAVMSAVMASKKRSDQASELKMAYSVVHVGAEAPTVKAQSSQGTTSIVIHNKPTIHVDGNAPDDLDDKLRRNNEALLDEVDDRLNRKDEDERRQSYE